MKQLLQEKKQYVNETTEYLLQLVPRKTLTIGKWSNKEILGHLVDSAANNHQRFIRSQFFENMIFMGYNQNEWIEVSNYNSFNWDKLVYLWKNYNLLLIHIVENMSGDFLNKLNKKHNIDQIGLKEVTSFDEITMKDLVIDYFNHMEHHLIQIFKQSDSE